MKPTEALLVSTVAALLAAVAVPGGAARAGNLSSHDGASWYGKHLSVSSGTAAACTGGAGQLRFDTHVDASHECGSQSETYIATNAAGSVVIAGSKEIQRLPMRAMASTDGGSTFTGADLPLPPPLTSGVSTSAPT